MKPDTTIARLVHDQLGMVTRSQALDAGLTSDQIDHLVCGGLLVLQHGGVYRHAAVPLTWRGRLMAGTLAAGSGAVASHRSAGRLHTLREVPRWRPEVTVAQTDLPLVSWLHVHRTNFLDALDVTAVD